MDINQDTQKRNITIQSLEFTVPAPYAEGHELKANEADVLNQTLAENLRNNFAPQVKSAITEHGEDGVNADELQTALDAYVEGYEFGARRGGGTSRAPVNPIEREAIAIATGHVKAAMRKKGLKISDFTVATIREHAVDLIAAQPIITEEATRRVAEQDAIANDVLGNLDLSTLDAKAPVDETEAEATVAE